MPERELRRCCMNLPAHTWPTLPEYTDMAGWAARPIREECGSPRCGCHPLHNGARPGIMGPYSDERRIRWNWRIDTHHGEAQELRALGTVPMPVPACHGGSVLPRQGSAGAARSLAPDRVGLVVHGLHRPPPPIAPRSPRRPRSRAMPPTSHRRDTQGGGRGGRAIESTAGVLCQGTSCGRCEWTKRSPTIARKSPLHIDQKYCRKDLYWLRNSSGAWTRAKPAIGAGAMGR